MADFWRYIAFIFIRRGKNHIFLDVEQEAPSVEVLEQISRFNGVPVEDMALIYNGTHLDPNKKLGYYGITGKNAKVHTPLELALIFKKADGTWEDVDMAPLSTPEDMPAILKLPVEKRQIEKQKDFPNKKLRKPEDVSVKS